MIHETFEVPPNEPQKRLLLQNFLRFIKPKYKQMSKLVPLVQYCNENFESQRFSWTDLETQSYFYQNVISDPQVIKYPPSSRYATRFLKTYIDAVEAQKKEIDQNILEMYLELLNTPILDQQMQDIGYRHFEIPYSGGESRTIIIKMTEQLHSIGLRAWEAGYFLSEYIATNPTQFKGKRCLELGSGVGVTGIVLGYCAPSVLILSDYLDSVLDNLKENLHNNNIQTQSDILPDLTSEHQNITVVKKLDWEKFTGKEIPIVPDIILAADVVYDLGLAKDLAHVLRYFLDQKTESGSSPFAIFATTKRNPDTFRFFVDYLRDVGIEHSVLGGFSRRLIFEYDFMDNICLSKLVKMN